MPKPNREAFSFFHSAPVRFRDVDVGGHAHHSTALVFFEEARVAYWDEVVGRSSIPDVDYILADAHVRYHERILYPGTLTVGVRVSVLGKKHFEMEYGAWSQGGAALISGTTTQVMFDYESDSAVPIPSFVRELIESQDGPF